MAVISISMSGDELKQFDRLVEHFGFGSRSSAVRAALSNFVALHQMQFKGHVHMALTLVYAMGTTMPMGGARTRKAMPQATKATPAARTTTAPS